MLLVPRVSLSLSMPEQQPTTTQLETAYVFPRLGWSHLRRECRVACTQLAVGVDPGPAWQAGSQLLFALHSSAGKQSPRASPHRAVPHQMQMPSQLWAVGSKHLQSPGRLWETPARCPEMGVGQNAAELKHCPELA